MEITIDVTNDSDETYRLVCKSRVIAQWEQTFRGASLAKLERDGAASDLVAIAFIGAKRAGKWDGNLAGFQESHDIKVYSPHELRREKALAVAKEKANDAGEPWTDDDTFRFNRQYDKDFGENAPDETTPYGEGPTPQGR